MQEKINKLQMKMDTVEEANKATQAKLNASEKELTLLKSKASVGQDPALIRRIVATEIAKALKKD